jgi:hypothetical protein
MKGWILRHWVISLVAAFVAGAGVGGGTATSTSKEPQLRQSLAAARAELASTEGDLEEALRDADDARSEGEVLEAEVEAMGDRLANLDAEWDRLDERTGELAELRATLVSREKRVAETTKRVNELEAKLRAELHRVQNSTITEGTWQIGVDIEPGVYRARGGASCYWAILNSLDNFDIANNGGFTPNQTVQLTSGWFESSDCGEWKKIG